MKLREAYRATTHWGPFVARTVGYGLISLGIGPLTREHRASLWAMRSWCRSSVAGLDIAVDASGLENVPQDGPFIYCSNHQSLLDILALGAVLPGDFKWAAKQSLMKIPFLGWHLRLAGHVPVDRTVGSRAAVDAIARFEQVLKSGKLLLVFPEGTRRHGPDIGVLFDGTAYLAVKLGVPIVPVGIGGSEEILASGKKMPRLHKVSVRVGAPIYPPADASTRKRADLAAISDELMKSLQSLFDDARAEAGCIP